MTFFRPANMTRRHSLLTLATATANAALPARAQYANPVPGGDTEEKFDGKGNVRYWPGNTIICPLPFDSPAFAAMLDINTEVTRSFRDYIAATPPASYHMTIYGCADQTRRVASSWPRGIPRDAPIETVDRILLQRLQNHRFRYPAHIRVRVDPRDHYPGLCAIPVVPVDATEKAMLYALRSEIADVTGLVAPDISTFRFHMTFGYQFRAMPPEIAASYRKASYGWRRLVASRSEWIEMKAPIFCHLDDMFAFHPITTLQRVSQ